MPRAPLPWPIPGRSSCWGLPWSLESRSPGGERAPGEELMVWLDTVLAGRPSGGGDRTAGGRGAASRVRARRIARGGGERWDGPEPGGCHLGGRTPERADPGLGERWPSTVAHEVKNPLNPYESWRVAAHSEGVGRIGTVGWAGWWGCAGSARAGVGATRPTWAIPGPGMGGAILGWSRPIRLAADCARLRGGSAAPQCGRVVVARRSGAGGLTPCAVVGRETRLASLRPRATVDSPLGSGSIPAGPACRCGPGSYGGQGGPRLTSWRMSRALSSGEAGGCVG